MSQNEIQEMVAQDMSPVDLAWEKLGCLPEELIRIPENTDLDLEPLAEALKADLTFKLPGYERDMQTVRSGQTFYSCQEMFHSTPEGTISVRFFFDNGDDPNVSHNHLRGILVSQKTNGRYQVAWVNSRGQEIEGLITTSNSVRIERFAPQESLQELRRQFDQTQHPSATAISEINQTC